MVFTENMINVVFAQDLVTSIYAGKKMAEIRKLSGCQFAMCEIFVFSATQICAVTSSKRRSPF